MVDLPGRERDRFRWSWRRGDAIDAGTLGDPLATTDYAICIFGGDVPVFGAALPGGSTCGSRSCWQRRSNGSLIYRSADLTPDGIRRLSLKPGLSGRSSLTAVGRGEHLLLPALPLSLDAPLTAQALAADPATTCWESVYLPFQVRQVTANRSLLDARE